MDCLGRSSRLLRIGSLYSLTFGRFVHSSLDFRMLRSRLGQT